MDLDARRLQYELHARTIYALRPILLREWRGNAAKLKEVEEYCALAEEIVACTYDANRCGFEAGRQDESPRGKGAAIEYRNTAERCAKRAVEISPRVAELKTLVGA